MKAVISCSKGDDFHAPRLWLTGLETTEEVVKACEDAEEHFLGLWDSISGYSIYKGIECRNNLVQKEETFSPSEEAKNGLCVLESLLCVDDTLQAIEFVLQKIVILGRACRCAAREIEAEKYIKAYEISQKARGLVP